MFTAIQTYSPASVETQTALTLGPDIARRAMHDEVALAGRPAR
jgi:hypothetical protein